VRAVWLACASHAPRWVIPWKPHKRAMWETSFSRRSSCDAMISSPRPIQPSQERRPCDLCRTVRCERHVLHPATLQHRAEHRAGVDLGSGEPEWRSQPPALPDRPCCGGLRPAARPVSPPNPPPAAPPTRSDGRRRRSPAPAALSRGGRRAWRSRALAWWSARPGDRGNARDAA
jgi:hypothetical protein